MATTIDGFIAKKDGDSDWVSPVDTDNFMAEIRANGCIIVGRNTYEQFYGDLYPVDGVTNIVATSKPETGKKEKNVYFVSGSPDDIITFARDKGHNKALLIGGSITNAHFIKAGIVNEIILSVHPLILGEGIPLLAETKIDKRLELVSCKQLAEGLVQLHYQLV